MSWSGVYVHHSPLYNWTVLFCVFWPFAAFGFLSRRGTSSAPVAAIVLSCAVTTMLMWVGFINTLRGMAVSGGGRASTAASFSEALTALFLAAIPIAVITIASLVRRHRPIVDRVCAAIGAAILAEIAGALLFARVFTLAVAWVAVAGAIFSLLLALIATVWLVLIVRGRVQPKPIPAGVRVFVVTYAIMAVIVYQHSRHYLLIAMGR